MTWKRAAFPIMAGMFIAFFAEAAEPLVGVASVIDGDTVEVHGQRIRFHGIDAPESRQDCLRNGDQEWRCGQQASMALADRIGRAPVSCHRTDTDRYGRMIGICRQDGTDLNAWMVIEGWAVAYRQYADGGRSWTNGSARRSAASGQLRDLGRLSLAQLSLAHRF